LFNLIVKNWSQL